MLNLSTNDDFDKDRDSWKICISTFFVSLVNRAIFKNFSILIFKQNFNVWIASTKEQGI